MCVFVCVQSCEKDSQCGGGMCCAVSLWIRSLRMCTPMGQEGDDCHPMSHKVSSSLDAFIVPVFSSTTRLSCLLVSVTCGDLDIDRATLEILLLCAAFSNARYPVKIKSHTNGALVFPGSFLRKKNPPHLPLSAPSGMRHYRGGQIQMSLTVQEPRLLPLRTSTAVTLFSACTVTILSAFKACFQC